MLSLLIRDNPYALREMIQGIHINRENLKTTTCFLDGFVEPILEEDLKVNKNMSRDLLLVDIIMRYAEDTVLMNKSGKKERW